MLNNFHRLVWTLDEQAAALELYEAEKPNKFWLVPQIYSGPTKTIESSKYPAGSLCYLVEYEGTDMKTIWKNLRLFKAGTQPAGEPLKKNKPPLADEDTHRLEAKITMGGKKSILTLVLHPSNPDRMYVNKTPKGMYGPSGEDGWAKVDR